MEDSTEEQNAITLGQYIMLGQERWPRMWTTEAGARIMQFAKEYHAKKCAECPQKKAPYKLFGVD